MERRLVFRGAPRGLTGGHPATGHPQQKHSLSFRRLSSVSSMNWMAASHCCLSEMERSSKALCWMTLCKARQQCQGSPLASQHLLTGTGPAAQRPRGVGEATKRVCEARHWSEMQNCSPEMSGD